MPLTAAAAKGSRPRQDPVSCTLCRTKKLKCNRQYPCSNCLARGVSCTLGNAVLPAVTAVPRNTAVTVDSNQILSRLDRIESLLLTQRPSISTPGERNAVPSDASPVSTATTNPNSTTHTITAEHEVDLRNDSLKLYGVATRDKSLLFTEGYDIHIRVSPLSQLLARAKAPIDGFVGYSTAWEPRRVFWLPTKEEALQLLSQFQDVVDFAHHVLYIKDARAVLEEVYSSSSNNETIEPSSLGLLFGAFAGVAGHVSCSSTEDDLFPTNKDAFDICKLWLRHGMDCLSISRRVGGAGTIRDVVMAICLCFLTFNLEGFSIRARSLHSSALTIARDLGLHRIDSPEGREEQVNTKESPITTEIKRRLWWHIASTDWLLGVSGGPQEGTYFVNPKHMCVNRPRNVTDEELETQGPWLNHSLDVPTEMSYFLLRIRSAELARMICDAWPMASSDVEKVDYGEIVAVDVKFEEMIRDTPVFFRLDEDSRRRSKPITDKYPYFIVQKYLIGIAVHMRRCKLHQPFLVRGSQDERFRYSREACIRAARTVIHAKQQLDEENEEIIAKQLPLNLFVLHHLFVATIVLVMDLCFNRAEGPDDARRSEVMYACRSLETTTTTSRLASKFLASLTAVLRKHRIYLTPQAASAGVAGEDGMSDHNMAAHASSFKMLNQGPVEGIDEGQAEAEDQYQQRQGLGQTQHQQQQQPPFQLDDVWQEWVNQGANFEPTNWDSLFADLENPSNLSFDMDMNLNDVLPS